jgi:hypothetical protein
MSLSSDNSFEDDNVDFSDSTNEKNCATSRGLPRRTAANADTEAHADRSALQSASRRAC